MPNVPQYTPNQVSSAPLPTPRQNIGIASPDVYGAGIAEGFSRGHIAVANARREEKDRVVTTDVLMRMDEWIKKDDEARNGENGFMLRQGDKARTSVKEYGEYNKKSVEDIASKIKDPETQQAFRNAVARRYQSNESSLVSRTGQVLQQHTEDTMAKSVVTDREAAVSNFMTAVSAKNPNGSYNADLVMKEAARLQESIDAQRATTRHLYTDIKGASPDVAEAEAQKAVDATVLMATQAMLNKGQYSEANDYIKAMAPQMSNEARLKAEPLVKDGVDRQKTITISQQIAGESDANGNPLNESEIRSRAQELTKDDSGITEGVINRAISERNRSIAAKAQDQDESYDGAYRSLMDGADYDKVVTPQMERDLRPQQVAALRSMAGIGKENTDKESYQNIAQTLTLKSLIDQGSVYDEASKTSRALTPAAVFSEAVARKLTTEQTKDVMKYFDGKSQKDVILVTDVNRVLKSLNLDPLEDQTKKYPDLFERVQNSLPAGKKATDTEMRKIVSDLFADGETKGSMSPGYGPNKTYIEAQRLGLSDEWIPDLLPNEEQSIMQNLQNTAKQAGKPAPIFDKGGVVVRRIKKYMVQGYPTPMGDNGQPLTPAQAIYLDIVTDPSIKKNNVLSPAKATPPKAPNSEQVGDFGFGMMGH